MLTSFSTVSDPLHVTVPEKVTGPTTILRSFAFTVTEPVYEFELCTIPSFNRSSAIGYSGLVGHSTPVKFPFSSRLGVLLAGRSRKDCR